MLKKKGIVFLLVMLILSLTIVQAFGETVEDLKKQQQNINKQIDKTKNELRPYKVKQKMYPSK